MSKIIIGIDSGVNTGVAIWDCIEQRLYFVGSMQIHQAMELVLQSNPALVRVEDARKRKWVKGGREKLQGAGSVKRDAKIWEDFLKDKKIVFEMVAPKDNTTKLDADSFKYRTGWLKPTNNHGRDAGMLVFGFTERNLFNTINILRR